MQAIRNLSLALTVLFVAGCSSFTSENSPNLPRNAQWGIVPMINYSRGGAAQLCPEHQAQIAVVL